MENEDHILHARRAISNQRLAIPIPELESIPESH